MVSGAPTAIDVKRANRKLYDAVASDYEAIDGRRDQSLSAWIRRQLRQLATKHGAGRILDLGAGSGLITRQARGIFRETVALDLSPSILAAAKDIAHRRIAADTDALPFADQSFNVVTCFAVLHHLYDTAALADEVARVLKPGGAFWSDHDMDAAFHNRFRWPLTVYRRMRAAEAKYTAVDGIDEKTYELAEFRENGVDSDRFARQLRNAHLSPQVNFHWFGLTGLTDRLFRDRRHRRGWAPLLSVVAVKPRTERRMFGKKG